jgi:two-component system nitrate/nitrite response regulator NarL
LSILAECHDGIAALQSIRQFAPDIAVLDIAMPGLNGLEVLASIVGEGLNTKVMFLTAFASDERILAAIAHGAKGIMLKDATPDSLVECIRNVAAGKQWFPIEVVEIALKRDAGRRSNSEDFVRKLTPREKQIAILVADGLSNKTIARRFDLTEGTVKVHLHNIYEKLEVPNRTALTALAIAYQNRLHT